jgi:hypothetical protein
VAVKLDGVAVCSWELSRYAGSKALYFEPQLDTLRDDCNCSLDRLRAMTKEGLPEVEKIEHEHECWTWSTLLTSRKCGVSRTGRSLQVAAPAAASVC